MFIGISTLQAQQLDSVFKEKQKAELVKLESKTDTFKKQQQEKIKDSNAKIIAELKKDSLVVANKIQSVKASIKTKTDSTARSGYEAKGKEALKKELQPQKDVVILIGPEGDFSVKEIQSALEHHFIPVSLGQTRLRTETAAVVACHSVVFKNED